MDENFSSFLTGRCDTGIYPMEMFWLHFQGPLLKSRITMKDRERQFVGTPAVKDILPSRKAKTYHYIIIVDYS
jgi:hypothetical protein